MDGHQCVRCGQFWASQAGPPKRFEAITKWCPDCIPVVLTPLTKPPPPKVQADPRLHHLAVNNLVRRPGRSA